MSESSSECQSRVVDVGAEWSPVVVAGAIRHKKLPNMALIVNVVGVEWWAPEAKAAASWHTGGGIINLVFCPASGN